MKRVAFHTLGCKLNFSETSSIARQLVEEGYERVGFEENPDVFVINTCSVTDNADRKCRKIVRDAKRVNPDSFVALVGCYAQLRPKEISEIEGVDAVLGASEKFKMTALLRDFEKTAVTQTHVSDIAEAHEFHTSFSYQDRTRSFLKVQDGCNYGCAFCTIPLARGRSRSDSIDSVVAEARKLADTPVREVVLTGVNTGDFGIQNGKRRETFLDLIRALDEVDGIDRFRISSIEPNLLSEEIIAFVSDSNRFVPHFHVPLQSGSDEILHKMNRRYRTDLYSSRISHIREKMPDACIGVDVIVGFPGETDQEFSRTFEYLNALDVSYLHVFTYSERPDTRAIEMPGVVSQKDRDVRSKILRTLSMKKRRHFYSQHVGSTRSVLFEDDIKDGRIHGFTDNYIRVSVPLERDLLNEIVPVQLQNLNSEGIVQGEPAKVDVSATIA